MLFNLLKNAGKLEPFERKSTGLVLCLVAPGLYLYSILIFWLRPTAIEINGARLFFLLLFLLFGAFAWLNKKWVANYYGWLSFFPLWLFGHYLIYTTFLNSFAIDYLLGTYIVIFGSILILSNRVLIVFLSATQLLHMIYRVQQSSLDVVLEGAIIISMSAIFFYSFIILNGAVRYSKMLLEVNKDLERKVTERTSSLEERAKELSERNKDLEEFAYVVSHDLKRPLRNIYTISQWLVEDSKDKFDEEIVNNLDLIKEQVTQMDLLVEGILNYSLQDKTSEGVVAVDLNVLLKRLIAVNISKNCAIVMNGEFPTIIVNESQILQVFQNLIQNAIKHNDKEQIAIAVDYKNEERFHLFSIKDNGPGIEEKYFEKIFQLFQKLEIKSEVDSIGIGLALVKKIINRSGGTIWLESEQGIGTTFFFTLPKKGN